MTTLSIQSSFEEVILDVQSGKEVEDSFWINFISTSDLDNGEAREEIIKVSKSGDAIVFANDNSVEFVAISKHYYMVISGSETFHIRSPFATIETGITDTTAFDISPLEDLYIIGQDSGTIHVASTDITYDTPALKVDEAHFSTVVKAMFFPSGKVALTAGLDLQIKIWDLENGTSPRGFLGHTERITDVLMVERGRNFISSSYDGAVKLWDCGSGNNITSLRRSQSLKDGITALHIAQGSSHLAKSKSSYEYGTLGKNVYAGHSSGVISVFDLGSRDELLNIQSLRSPVVSLCGASNDHLLYAAYESGAIAKWDMRNTDECLVEVNLGTSINCMSLGKDLTVSYNSGYCVTLNCNTLVSKECLVGTEDYCKFIKASDSAAMYLTGMTGSLYKY